MRDKIILPFFEQRECMRRVVVLEWSVIIVAMNGDDNRDDNIEE